MKDSEEYILCKPLKRSLPEKVFLYPHRRLNQISKTFKESRIRSTLSQKEIACKLNVSTNYVYMIEAGIKFPSMELCMALASLTNFNPKWIRSIWINEAVARKQLHFEEKGEKI